MPLADATYSPTSFSFMNPMTIDNQEDGLRRTEHALFEEGAEYRGGDQALVQHDLAQR